MQRRQSRRRDLVDAAGRPGDAGIVDQRVEAAQALPAPLEQRGRHRPRRDIGLDRIGLGMRLAGSRPARSSETSQIATCAPLRDERVGDGAADAGGAGRDQDALACSPARSFAFPAWRSFVIRFIVGRGAR